VKNLKTPERWTWAAPENSEQYKYNHRRLQFWASDECRYVIKHCDVCKSTGLLVGVAEIASDRCDTCLDVAGLKDPKKKEELEKVCTLACIILISYHLVSNFKHLFLNGALSSMRLDCVVTNRYDLSNIKQLL